MESNAIKSRNAVASQRLPDQPMRSRVLRLPEVVHKTGLSRSAVYALTAEKQFPSSIRLSERAVGWLESQVEAWIDQRVSLSQGGSA